jgi:hypothetical protein
MSASEKRLADLWVGGDHLHPDKAFGGIVADLEVAQVCAVHVFDRGVRPRCASAGSICSCEKWFAEAQFLVETQHRLPAFEIGLHRDAFLHSSKA